MLNKMPDFFPSGIYVFPNEIPYYSQFASPELAYSYVHENFDGVSMELSWLMTISFGVTEPAGLLA